MADRQLINIGDRFGRLTVTSVDAARSGSRPYWLCRCDCGGEKSVRNDHLLSGMTRSCRCLSGEISGARIRTHGGSGSTEHLIWKGIRNRTRNPNNPCYHRYGGRGIKLCERWESFENFLADMGPRPSPQHSIERADNNGDYCPENCSWILTEKQARNRRDTRYITIGPTTMSASDWADLYGVPSGILVSRLNKGFEPLQALTMPVFPDSRHSIKVRKRGIAASCL